jgi:hypothetical protein
MEIQDDDQKKFKEIQKIFMIEKIKRQNTWTGEEDNQLLQLVQMYSSKNWKEISRNFVNKKSIQCYSRYKQIKPGIKKGPWDNEEDEEVKKYVDLYGHQWSYISNLIKTRNGKQIRDRYLNYINPSTKHNEFTEDEDETIKRLYLKHGSRWSHIAQYCNGRTGDLIKNRFYSHIKKKILITRPVIKKRFRSSAIEILKNVEEHNTMRREKRSPTSKFRKENNDDEMDIEKLQINGDDNIQQSEDPEVHYYDAIPTIPSNDKCASLFDTKFVDKKNIDEIIKENHSIFSEKSLDEDRELSHSSFLYENNPFDYSSSSCGSSSDFDIKSQNYMI